MRLALTKGRIEKQTIALFEKIGFDCSELKDKGRKLILPVENFEVLLAKPDDVITYIEYGVCDLGIVGKDTIAQKGGKFYEVLDLGFGKCRFALANKKDVDFYAGSGVKTIATKYPNVARNYFQSKNMDIRIIKIEGSVEVAPLLGLADGIVDIVETGNTLVANGLEVKEWIMDISSRLIVNTASMKLKMEEINEFIRKIENVKI
ncbi:MAG: ATP phosphoribosyltransferase [Oscillospiraceae bacterium]|jgi:ATP phosphoribosyltransferase|nr:ATP phosphoribosyltransferase [Oscillospiraceae bacterium]